MTDQILIMEFIFPTGKKNSQNDQYKKLSILDKILQNIGKSAGKLE